MANELVLSIDIGNTNTHTGLVDCGALSCLASEVFPTAEIQARLLSSLLSLVQTQAKPDPKSLPVVLCSVANDAQALISSMTPGWLFGPAQWLEWSRHLPLSIAYQNTQALGPDRLANCLYGNAAFPGKSQIIIDVGTAITVDFMKNGSAFVGGAILPGVTTQLKSLHNHTDALPLVNAANADAADLEFPGTSTEACMISGVRFGTAGALTFMVNRYRELFGADCIVLATGGAWKLVEKLVTFDYTYIPELTLIGTGLYYKAKI
jgi:type III pantothenate kinase